MNLPETTIAPESPLAPTERYGAIRGINNAAIIIGLQSKHVYAGTVPEAGVRQRRAKNRAARRARRGNISALRRQARLNRKVRRPSRRMPYDMGHLLGTAPGAPWLIHEPEAGAAE